MLKKDLNDILFKLSNTEKEIHSYILNHLDLIENLTIRDLASSTYTNTSTIMRYCKKIGYSGFDQFKHSFKNDIKKLNYDSFLINDSENTIHCVNKMKILYDEVVEKTSQLLSIAQLDRIIDTIHNHSYVSIIAYDANIALAEYAIHYFSLIGKICNIYSSIDQQIQFSMHANPKDYTVFIITRSGSTDRIKKVVKILNKRGFYVVLFTQRNITPISIYCDECIAALYDNNFDKMGDCIFYTSVKFILDCLVAIYYSKHYQKTLSYVDQYNNFFFENNK